MSPTTLATAKPASGVTVSVALVPASIVCDDGVIVPFAPALALIVQVSIAKLATTVQSAVIAPVV